MPVHERAIHAERASERCRVHKRAAAAVLAEQVEGTLDRKLGSACGDLLGQRQGAWREYVAWRDLGAHGDTRVPWSLEAARRLRGRPADVRVLRLRCLRTTQTADLRLHSRRHW
jgi:hypothetical protein